jgi:hypothetical protein
MPPGNCLRPVVSIIGRREAAIGGERVLIFTPGVPYMAPNDVVRRGEAHAAFSRRVSSVDWQNMSRGRKEWQLPLPETSPRSWIFGLGMNSSVGSRGATPGKWQFANSWN